MKKKSDLRQVRTIDIDVLCLSLLTFSIADIVPSLVKKTLSQHKIRTSQTDRTLDSMFPLVNPLQVEDSSSRGHVNTPDIPESKCYLQSVQILREKMDTGKHRG